MKPILVMVLLSFSMIGQSQDIAESIYSFKDKFSPLFSKDKSVLNVQFVKQYNIQQGDTTYQFLVDLEKDQFEVTGISLGTAVFRNNLAFSANQSYERNTTTGESDLGKEEFFEFYECIKSVHSFIGQAKEFSKSKNDMVASCSVGNLLMGGEYHKGSFTGNSEKYYFRVGEENTYSMNKEQFVEIVQVLRKIKLYWEKR